MRLVARETSTNTGEEQADGVNDPYRFMLNSGIDRGFGLEHFCQMRTTESGKVHILLSVRTFN